MTIEKGKEWGSAGFTPAGATTISRDAMFHSLSPDTPAVLAGGDLYEALGHPRPHSPGEPCMLVQIDALQCHIRNNNGDTELVHAASYVSVGRYLFGEFTVVSNSGFWRHRHIAPRSHPNDGQFDVVSIDGTMSLRQRIIAYNKMKTSTHIPHPQVTSRRGTTITLDRVGSTHTCMVDGVRKPHWRTITISMVPDYWTVIL